MLLTVDSYCLTQTPKSNSQLILIDSQILWAVLIATSLLLFDQQTYYKFQR